MEWDGRHPQSPVSPGLTVNVLGGTFYVSELQLNGHESPEAVTSILRELPADRWFVMVSDHPGDAQDALAMIDDALELQIYARGVLRQD